MASLFKDPTKLSQYRDRRFSGSQEEFELALLTSSTERIEMMHSFEQGIDGIVTGNGLGALFGFAQLVLYDTYYKSTPKRSNVDVKKASEVQI